MTQWGLDSMTVEKLIELVKTGDLAAVKEFLAKATEPEKSKLVNGTISIGGWHTTTVLNVAATAGHIAIAAELVLAGAMPQVATFEEIFNSKKAELEKLKMVAALCEPMGKNILLKSDEKTSDFSTVHHDKPKSNIEMPTGYVKISQSVLQGALIKSVRTHHLWITRYLLRRVKYLAFRYAGETLAHQARSGQMARLLAEEKVNFNVVASYSSGSEEYGLYNKRSPLHSYLQDGTAPRFFIQCGVDINNIHTGTNIGNTVLSSYYVKRSVRKVALIKELIAAANNSPLPPTAQTLVVALNKEIKEVQREDPTTVNTLLIYIRAIAKINTALFSEKYEDESPLELAKKVPWIKRLIDQEMLRVKNKLHITPKEKLRLKALIQQPLPILELKEDKHISNGEGGRKFQALKDAAAKLDLIGNHGIISSTDDQALTLSALEAFTPENIKQLSPAERLEFEKILSQLLGFFIDLEANIPLADPPIWDAPHTRKIIQIILKLQAIQILWTPVSPNGPIPLHRALQADNFDIAWMIIDLLLNSAPRLQVEPDFVTKVGEELDASTIAVAKARLALVRREKRRDLFDLVFFPYQEDSHRIIAMMICRLINGKDAGKRAFGDVNALDLIQVGIEIADTRISTWLQSESPFVACLQGLKHLPHTDQVHQYSTDDSHVNGNQDAKAEEPHPDQILLTYHQQSWVAVKQCLDLWRANHPLRRQLLASLDTAALVTVNHDADDSVSQFSEEKDTWGQDSTAVMLNDISTRVDQGKTIGDVGNDALAVATGVSPVNRERMIVLPKTPSFPVEPIASQPTAVTASLPRSHDLSLV